MLRYTVLSVLLVACYMRAQATDVDDSTVEWIKKVITENNQNNKDNLNSQPSNRGKDLTETEVNAALNWVKDIIIPTDLKTRFNNSENSEQTVNLNPSNIDLKNSSFSRPGQPANQNYDEDNSTPHPETPCTSEDGFSGVCVLYYLCDVNTRKVIGDGTHLIDIRFGSNTTGRVCPHYLDVCCQLKNRVTPPQVQKLVVHKVPLQVSGLSVGLYRPQKIDEDLMRVSDPFTGDSTVELKLQQQCGWNRPEQFIFQPPNQEVADSGVYANYGEFPWMVALMRKSKTKVWVQDDFRGGGSLIHPSVVMTANHRLLKVTAAQLKCRAGEWDTQTDKEQYGIQERDADRFVSHPGFYKTSLYYDVALIFLKEPFELAGAPHIGTACLAPELPDSRATCFGMGWGKDVDYKENVHILKKVRLSLVEHKSCQEMLHKNTRFRLNPKFVLHESLTCAGGEENVDTCEGDGGSPLVCRIGNSKGRTRYAVVGIVAYGLGCGVKNVPGVYVNVPHVYTWVQQQMAENNYTSDTFTY